MDIHPLLSKMKAETLRLLYLWIHAGDGASMTVAELELLTDRSPYHVKVALKELAKGGLSTYSGLADHAVCQLTINAYNLFMPDQPTGRQFEIPRSPAGQMVSQPSEILAQPSEPSAGQPTVQFSTQNSLQKNFFSPEKIFSPSEEEEDLYVLNLNNIKSSSSSESAPVEKNIFHPPDLEERLKALEDYAKLFSKRIRMELAILPHCTPEYVRLMACGFYHVEGYESPKDGGWMRRRLLDGWPAPERLCLDCWREDHPPEPEPEEEETHSTPKSPVAMAEILGWDGVGMEPEAAWQAAMGQLQSEMPKATFDSWVRDARFAGYDHGTFRMQFYNAYARDWCQARLSSQFTRILRGFFNREVALEFISLGDDHVV